VRSQRRISRTETAPVLDGRFVETDADNQAHEWTADISLAKESDAWRIDRMALNRQESAPKPAREC
jgi:hypothetical protein